MSAARWAWPLPRLASVRPRLPIITQRFKPASHLGVDVMYRWCLGDPAAPPRAALMRGGAPVYAVPEGVPVLAAADGLVLYALLAANGWRTRVRTADGTDYLDLHMTVVRVAQGDYVTQGQVLGICGGDPTDAPDHTVHVHHERRRRARDGEAPDDHRGPGGAGYVAYDPEPDLVGAVVLEAPDDH